MALAPAAAQNCYPPSGGDLCACTSCTPCPSLGLNEALQQSHILSTVHFHISVSKTPKRVPEQCHAYVAPLQPATADRHRRRSQRLKRKLRHAEAEKPFTGCRFQAAEDARLRGSDLMPATSAIDSGSTVLLCNNASSY